MTETPERAWPAKISLLREHQDEILDYMCVSEFVTTDDPTGNYVLETALEAAQARIAKLEARLREAADLVNVLVKEAVNARREALEEAAKVNWVEAPYVPHEWEGKEAWKYVDIANSPSRRVTLDMVPHDYSRDEDHCGGVWFALFTPPAPPPCALMENPNES